MLPSMIKYPRTRHVEGSRLQHGDHDLGTVPFAAIRGRHLVIEEKMDGANAAVSFGDDGRLLLQSRGHYLTGGPRERHFDLLKQWAAAHAEDLYLALGDRYIMYGEWLYAKHTIFYDQLPHYFLEFDLRDRDGRFWSTARREAHLAATGAAAIVRSVPVLWRGRLDDPRRLPDLVGPSRYKSPRWREALAAAAAGAGVDAATAGVETDPSDHAEGLYLKVEDDDHVVARYKWIRASFLTSVIESGSHWLARPIVPNQLAPGVDLFAAPSP